MPTASKNFCIGAQRKDPMTIVDADTFLAKFATGCGRSKSGCTLVGHDLFQHAFVAACFYMHSFGLPAVALAFGFGSAAFAADNRPEPVAQFVPAYNAATGQPINSGDNAWVLASAALVLMMTAPGLILFYGGLVRSKNVLSTMMHSLILMAVVSTMWMVFGYSMAFGEGNAIFGNPLKHLFLQGVGADARPGLRGHHTEPDVHALPDDVCHHHAGADQRRDRGAHPVQGVSAVHRAVDDGGLFSALPHDVGQGRAVQLGAAAEEFPRSISRAARWCTSVRACPRWSARWCWAGAMVIPQEPMMPHNVVYSLIGAGLLWVGWFGFNAGSALSAGGLATSAFAATHFSAAAAALELDRHGMAGSKANPACSARPPAWWRDWRPSPRHRVSCPSPRRSASGWWRAWSAISPSRSSNRASVTTIRSTCSACTAWAARPAC